MSKQRRLLMTDKSNKKADQADIDKCCKHVAAHHGDSSFGAKSSEDIAQDMVSAGSAGDTFAGVGMHIERLDEQLVNHAMDSYDADVPMGL